MTVDNQEQEPSCDVLPGTNAATDEHVAEEKRAASTHRADQSAMTTNKQASGRACATDSSVIARAKRKRDENEEAKAKQTSQDVVETPAVTTTKIARAGNVATTQCKDQEQEDDDKRGGGHSAPSTPAATDTGMLDSDAVDYSESEDSVEEVSDSPEPSKNISLKEYQSRKSDDDGLHAAGSERNGDTDDDAAPPQAKAARTSDASILASSKMKREERGIIHNGEPDSDEEEKPRPKAHE